MRCPKCEKPMKPDTENKRYVCKCGKVIVWASALKSSKLASFYI